MADKITGNDAAYIKPKLIPDFELLPRDDSGGPEFNPYNAQFGDGGFVQGAKAHLSASGGTDDEVEGDEQSDKVRTRGYDRKSGGEAVGDEGPASSKKRARE